MFGKADKVDAGDRVYRDLSKSRSMLGALNRDKTGREQKNGAETCCFHWFEYCSGRPLMTEQGPLIAPTQPGSSWETPAAEPARLVTGPLAQHLRDCWIRDAQMEHASVAAFARTTLELMGVGAPSHILAKCQRAALDEIDHAQRCFILAARYGGTAMQPGPLPPVAPRECDLAQLASNTLREGCFAETIAALAATRAARRCQVVEVRESLEKIAADEEGHAALAWEILHFALERGGDKVARAIELAAQDLSRQILEAGDADPGEASSEALAFHGRLTTAEHARVASEAWTRVILPLLASLVPELQRA
jgi:hypothetical protein